MTTVAPALSLRNSATPYDAPRLSQMGDNLHVGCSKLFPVVEVADFPVNFNVLFVNCKLKIVTFPRTFT